MKLPLSLLGYLIGFGASLLLWGKVEGDSGILPNLRLELGDKVLAIHHWFVFAVLIVILITFRSKTKISDSGFYFVLAILFGGMNHGLTYKDWWRFWL